MAGEGVCSAGGWLSLFGSREHVVIHLVQHCLSCLIPDVGVGLVAQQLGDAAVALGHEAAWGQAGRVGGHGR